MRFLSSLILLSLASRTLAESIFPMPSVIDVTTSDGLAIGVGLGIEYEAEYDGSDNYGAELDPQLVVQWRRGDQMWFLEGQELGWRGRINDGWLLQGGLRFEGDREESEAPELAGLGDVDSELMLMAEIRRAIGGNWANWLAGRVQAGDSDIGALAVLAVGHTFAAADVGTGLDVFAFTTFGSSDFVNRDFGITPEQSIGSGLSVTELDGGYRSFGVQAIGRWNWREDWQLRAEAGYEKYNGDISDSPIALDDFEAEIGLSLLYRF